MPTVAPVTQGDLFPTPPAHGALGAVDAWAHTHGFSPLIGVDEAGRGPLAGPVVAAAVCLPWPVPDELLLLDDSKKLSEASRTVLYDAIHTHALSVGCASVDAGEIDRVNILEATRDAMRNAIHQATEPLSADCSIFVDGHLPVPGLTSRQWPLVKGDARSFVVAAASVVAKVTRDRMMRQYALAYPGYGFERHKGYGTIDHRRALGRLGPSPIHRSSFNWSVPDE